jgi:hypothetical protein
MRKTGGKAGAGQRSASVKANIEMQPTTIKSESRRGSPITVGQGRAGGGGSSSMISRARAARGVGDRNLRGPWS